MELIGKHLKVQITGTKPILCEPGFKYGDYEDRCRVVTGIDEATFAKIRISMDEIISVPSRYVLPIVPMLSGQHVVVALGTIMGRKYTVVQFQPLECSLKLRGKRGSKIDKSLCTNELCVIL
jgi:hypothetical protein